MWLLRHEVIISIYTRVQRLISTYSSVLLLAISFCTTPESTTTLPTSQQVQLLLRGCSSKTFSADAFPTSNQFSLFGLESFESTWKLCGVNPCCAQNFKPLPLKVSHIKRLSPDNSNHFTKLPKKLSKIIELIELYTWCHNYLGCSVVSACQLICTIPSGRFLKISQK